MAWYSGVSGACCASPSDLFGSYDGWPLSPATGTRRHSPFHCGYFDSSNARAPDMVVSTAAARAIRAMEPRSSMTVLPGISVVPGSTRDDLGRWHTSLRADDQHLERPFLGGRATAAAE